MLESKTDELTVPLEGRAEMERAKFPTKFPGSLKINPNKENIPILHQQYRKVDTNNNVPQDFIWFVSVFLSRIQPLRTKIEKNEVNETFDPYKNRARVQKNRAHSQKNNVV